MIFFKLVLCVSGRAGNLHSLRTMSGIGNKRAAAEPGPSVPPEKKAGVEDSGTTVETIKLGGVSSTVCISTVPHLPSSLMNPQLIDPSHVLQVIQPSSSPPPCCFVFVTQAQSSCSKALL